MTPENRIQMFARRGYGYDQATQTMTLPTTFVSYDEADKREAGWVPGWFEDGASVEIDACRTWVLTHVYTPSWRAREPRMIDRETGAADRKVA